MSYDIFYKRLMIKVPQVNRLVYLPLVEHGDSNLWYSGNAGRVRNWKRLAGFGSENALLEKAQIMSVVDSWHTSSADRRAAYDDRIFSYYSGLSLSNRGKNTTSWRSFRNFFEAGFAEALTIEELKSHFGQNITGSAGKKVLINFSSTPELVDFIKQHWNPQELFKVGFTTSVDIYTYRRIRRHFKDHENFAVNVCR